VVAAHVLLKAMVGRVDLSTFGAGQMIVYPVCTVAIFDQQEGHPSHYVTFVILFESGSAQGTWILTGTLLKQLCVYHLML
jgi:hypothetical protein